MKKASIFAASLLLLLLASCCKKDQDPDDDPNPMTDYRDQFTGDYNCHKICVSWMIGDPQDDTLFNGPVHLLVSKDTASTNQIIVGQNTVPIDSSGHYFGMLQVPGYKFYTLDFRNDSVFLSTFSGGLGGGTDCNTTGKK